MKRQGGKGKGKRVIVKLSENTEGGINGKWKEGKGGECEGGRGKWVNRKG